jgi:hypothetical protein
MTPQGGPRRPKTPPRRLQDASKTTPRRLRDVPRYSRGAPKTAQNSPRHPKMLPRRPKTPMDASKTPPDLDFGASRPQFLELFTCKIVNGNERRKRDGVMYGDIGYAAAKYGCSPTETEANIQATYNATRPNRQEGVTTDCEAIFETYHARAFFSIQTCTVESRGGRACHAWPHRRLRLFP